MRDVGWHCPPGLWDPALPPPMGTEAAVRAASGQTPPRVAPQPRPTVAAPTAAFARWSLGCSGGWRPPLRKSMRPTRRKRRSTAPRSCPPGSAVGGRFGVPWRTGRLQSAATDNPRGGPWCVSGAWWGDWPQSLRQHPLWASLHCRASESQSESQYQSTLSRRLSLHRKLGRLPARSCAKGQLFWPPAPLPIIQQ